jgi:hypothetical protein
MGLLKGIYLYSNESSSEFKDWAADIPEEFFRQIIEEWEKSKLNKNATLKIESFIKAAIVVNQGFNDADRRGQQMQQQMVEMAAREGIRILGPNTLGVINSFADFTTSFMPVTKQRVGVGLICQSGIHFVGPTKFSGMIGKGVDLGNECKKILISYP